MFKANSKKEQVFIVNFQHTSHHFTGFLLVL